MGFIVAPRTIIYMNTEQGRGYQKMRVPLATKYGHCKTHQTHTTTIYQAVKGRHRARKWSNWTEIFSIKMVEWRLILSSLAHLVLTR